MAISSDEVKVYFVKATIGGEIKCLLSFKWTEQNAFIAEIINENPEVQLHIKSYMSTPAQVRKDIQTLLNLKGQDRDVKMFKTNHDNLEIIKK